MDSASDFEQNDEIENGIPKFTQWEHRFSLFGLHFYYVPSISKTFINHWEVSLCMPILVNCIIWGSYLLFLISYIFVLDWTLKPFIFITVLLSFYVLSYFGIILEGPGYLPFFYPHRYPTANNKYPDYLSGMVTTNQQLDFVKQRISMPDAHFFKSARRIVIRPDHFCDWCACFVGKKNFKLFFLFNFWGVLYICVFGVFTLLGFAKETENKTPNVFFLIFSMIYLFMAFFFCIFQVIFVVQTFYSILTDTREFESMKKGKKKGADIPLLENDQEYLEKTSCLKKFEDVFGSIKYWFLWLLPVGAFHGVDDYLLVKTRGDENDWFI